MPPTARRRALDALKGKRAPTPAGPLFAVAEEGADFVHDTLDKVAVLFPLPLPEPFDYRASSALALEPGMHVIAPIGPRLVRGVVWSVTRDDPGAANLKAIEEVLPGSPLPEVSRAFVDWAAKYLVRPPGDILRMVARSPEALLPPPTFTVLAPTGQTPPKLTEARRRVLEEAVKEQVSAAELARRADTSSAVVKGLVDCGALEKREISEDPPFPEPIVAPLPLEGGGAGGGGDRNDQDVQQHSDRRASPPPQTPTPPTGGGKKHNPKNQPPPGTQCAKVRQRGVNVA
ncbi:MAG: hypothetical protein JNM59_04345, partial [Hyphomonadaceae bacterium]|nr:hypothetical protein [Hyphomonadaceae bacterium]